MRHKSDDTGVGLLGELKTRRTPLCALFLVCTLNWELKARCTSLCVYNTATLVLSTENWKQYTHHSVQYFYFTLNMVYVLLTLIQKWLVLQCEFVSIYECRVYNIHDMRFIHDMWYVEAKQYRNNMTENDTCIESGCDQVRRTIWTNNTVTTSDWFGTSIWHVVCDVLLSTDRVFC